MFRQSVLYPLHVDFQLPYLYCVLFRVELLSHCSLLRLRLQWPLIIVLQTPIVHGCRFLIIRFFPTWLLEVILREWGQISTFILGPPLPEHFTHKNHLMGLLPSMDVFLESCVGSVQDLPLFSKMIFYFWDLLEFYIRFLRCYLLFFEVGIQDRQLPLIVADLLPEDRLWLL